MKLSDMKTSEQVLADELGDPAFKAEWDRTAVAREAHQQARTDPRRDRLLHHRQRGSTARIRLKSRGPDETGALERHPDRVAA
jgi:hypothetical protein